jgi:hypothetical protein
VTTFHLPIIRTQPSWSGSQLAHALRLAQTWTASDGQPRLVDERVHTPHKAIRRITRPPAELSGASQSDRRSSVAAPIHSDSESPRVPATQCILAAPLRGFLLVNTERMESDSAQRSAVNVGLITLPIGLVLVAAPSRSGRLLRLGDHPGALRAIGTADLVLVPGLLAGRRRWQWMTARAGLNLVIAAHCLRLARRDDAVGAKVGALAMVVATVTDIRTIVALRRGSDGSALASSR